MGDSPPHLPAVLSFFLGVSFPKTKVTAALTIESGHNRVLYAAFAAKND